MREQHFVWMDVAAFPGRLIVPRSDPKRYEWPADLLFDTADEANEWRDEQMDTDGFDPDESELAYIQSWALCVRTVETVDG